MTPPRKTKLYRKKMWAVVEGDRCWSIHDAPMKAYRCRGYAWRRKKRYDPRYPSETIPYRVGRVCRVLISELPKAAGRGRK